MMYLLPAPKESVNHRFSMVKKSYNYLKSKRGKYAIAAVLDFILILVILINGIQPASRMFSPYLSSLQSINFLAQHKITNESFAFVPGLARNKWSDIDLNGLTALSFFDVPLTEDGQINQDSRGYRSFTSGEALELFDRARYQKTKIFLTLSALDNDRINYILNNIEAQKTLADQAIQEIKDANIDGITIDFELPNSTGWEYQQKFTNFISSLTNQIHSQLPQIQVAVAVPSSESKKDGLYNIEALSKASDRIFLIASDTIVPEVKNNNPTNPVYGYNQNDYFNNLSSMLGDLFRKTSTEKLVMERAWYGNGDNYPLYVPNNKVDPEQGNEPASVILDRDTVERLVAGVPEKGRAAARRNIPIIGKALDAEGILDSNVLAYALATIEHETDETFEPLEEISGRVSSRRLGYEGGENYFGRGFIQLTHLRNYKMIGERIGMGDQLAKKPELAGTPEVAAKILAAFFKDNNVANLASRGQFVAARTPINPDYNGYAVADLALKYETE